MANYTSVEVPLLDTWVIPNVDFQIFSLRIRQASRMPSTGGGVTDRMPRRIDLEN